MHEKTNHSSLYVANNITSNNKQRKNGNSTANEDNEVDEKEDNNIQCEKQSTPIEFINISTTIPLAHDNLTTSVFEIHLRYYVDLHINFTAMN